METEIEAKFLAVDHDELRRKLHKLGAECVAPMRLMRRHNLDFPDRRLQKAGGWVRVRDEGNKITMSYKQLNDRTLHGTKEVCVTVDSFEHAKALLEAFGLVSASYQETKRESWRLDGVEIELDHWPWTKPYVEIEAANEAALKTVVAKLGLDWGEAAFGSVDVVYQNEYAITDLEFYSLATINFDLPLPALLLKRRRR